MCVFQVPAGYPSDAGPASVCDIQVPVEVCVSVGHADSASRQFTEHVFQTTTIHCLEPADGTHTHTHYSYVDIDYTHTLCCYTRAVIKCCNNPVF